MRSSCPGAQGIKLVSASQCLHPVVGVCCFHVRPRSETTLIAVNSDYPCRRGSRKCIWAAAIRLGRPYQESRKGFVISQILKWEHQCNEGTSYLGTDVSQVRTSPLDLHLATSHSPYRTYFAIFRCCNQRLPGQSASSYL